jgi:hypothetical protein
VDFLGQGAGIFERHRHEVFPLMLSVGDMSIAVKSQQELLRLCADRNLYLIARHHGQLEDDAERSLASTDYPDTYAFGGG